MEEDNKGATATTTAEELRLQGNDAFGTHDWERALELYQDSCKSYQQAKTYANMAATLCKLSRYDEASKAAERATTLDPSWAKGWWRRGVASELLKLFLDAVKFFSIAVELDPLEKGYKKALNSVKKRIKLQKAPDGLYVLDHPNEKGGSSKSPAVKAWLHVTQSIGGNTFTMAPRYFSTQSQYPTSQQWLFQGFSQWIIGMKGGIASLTLGVSKQAYLQFQALNQQQWDSQEAFLDAADELLGGFTQGQDLANFASGFSHLGGSFLVLETGGVGANGARPTLCPQPAFLSRYVAYQTLAALYSIDAILVALLRKLGFDQSIKCCQAVLSASTTLFENLGAKYPHKIADRVQDPSPVEIVQYIKDQLQAGKTWNGGLRHYISLQYRGTILYACVMRMMAQVAIAYKWEKWANEFITLADKEFMVSEQESYDEKGSAFRPSFRIGMMMSKLQSLNVLRGDAVNGPYSMEDSLNLCVKISNMAREMEAQSEASEDTYSNAQHDVAFRRKPLALAHSMIGAHLNAIEPLFSIQEFKRIAAHHGFIESIDSECDPFALIAEHYHIAAKNELPDAEHSALFWWAYAANMALASSESGYTIAQLVMAISMAEAAEKDRDWTLFGVNDQSGGSFETISLCTASHFQDVSDSFVLPRVKLIREGGNGTPLKTSLKVGDEDICLNFDEYERNEIKGRKNRYVEMMDTSQIEKEHGASFEGLPCLETLCIRELHKSGAEFAKGETDGAVIQYKAMMEALKEQTTS